MAGIGSKKMFADSTKMMRRAFGASVRVVSIGLGMGAARGTMYDFFFSFCRFLSQTSVGRAMPMHGLCVHVRGLRSSVSSLFALPAHTMMVMPALSPTMEKGSLESWNKKVGDRIKEGDKLALVETDKATIDFDAVEEGFLAQILVPAGTKDVAVNTPIAVIVEKAEDVAAFADFKASAAGANASPVAKETAAPPKEGAATIPPAAAAPAASGASGGRVFASPVAKKEAKERGLDLASVSGSGPNSRVVLADVLAAKQTSVQQQTVAASAPATPVVGGGFEDSPVSNIRRVTAQRLSEAKRTIPHYYLTVDTVIDELLRVRALLNAQGEVKLSVNDFVIKAVAKALQDVPALNSHWQESVIRRFSDVHVGVAVNTDYGLFVPVVRNADQKVTC